VQDLTIEGDQPLGPNSTTTDIAGYLFEEYQAAENTRLQAAIRFDFNHIQTAPYTASTDPVFQTLDTAMTSSAFTASIGAIQKLSEDMALSLNIGRSFRAPTVQELFANGLDAASGSYSLGDASLVPETGLGIDLSLKGTFNNFSFELSPYVNIINNYIYSYFTGADSMAFPVRQFAQTDARLAGFEASVMFQLAPTLGLKASVDYVNAEQTKDTVMPLPFIPPMHGLLALTYQDNTYSGTIEWRLAAAQNNLGTGDTYTAGYGIVNIGAGIRFNQQGMVHNISLHCDNIFNIAYRDNLSVIKDFIPQPGRGFRLAYDLLF
jgi:outer membrane receptor protein involved in Fe transport